MTAALLTGGCSGGLDVFATSDERIARMKEEGVADLLQRPNIEETVADYDAMLGEIRTVITRHTGRDVWRLSHHWTGHTGCHDRYKTERTRNAQSRFLDHWVLDGGMTPEQWRAVLTDLSPILESHGFGGTLMNSDLNGNGQQLSIQGPYDESAVSILFVADTVLSGSTGCHLPAADLEALRNGDR